MPIYLSNSFQEFPHGGYIAQRYDFGIGKDRFVMIFAEIDTVDRNYLAFRSKEAGFDIPPRCYDIKFDRLENFEQGTYYQPPSKGQSSSRFTFARELAEALKTIIALHHDIYQARAYMATAETEKLRRFYDRILQQSSHKVVYELSTGLGDGGMGYVFKTRYFND